MSLFIHLRFLKSPNSQKFPLESNLETCSFSKCSLVHPTALRASTERESESPGIPLRILTSSLNDSQNHLTWILPHAPPLKSYSPQEQEPRLTRGTPAPTYTHTKGRSFTTYSVLGLGEARPSRVLYSSDQKEESDNKITLAD